MLGFDYEIPDSIKEKVSDKFAFKFIANLMKEFKEGIIYACNYGNGSEGWKRALGWTCSELNDYWIKNYMDTLEWWELDKFYPQLTELCINKFIEHSIKVCSAVEKNGDEAP